MTDDELTAEELADDEAALWFIGDATLADLGPPTTQIECYGPTDKYLTQKRRELLDNGIELPPFMLVFLWEAAYYFPPEHRGDMTIEAACAGAMEVRNMDPDRPTYPRRKVK